jgi:hypothetical protein
MFKSLTLFAAAAVLGGGGYLYATPYISLNQLREAVESKDLPAIERHVDFPSVRASLKEQLKAKMTEEISSNSGDDPWVNLGMGALGYAIAEPMINMAVDAYISPAGLKTLLAGSQPQQVNNSGDQDSGLPSRSSDDATVNAGYKSLNLFVVTASDATDSASGQVVRFNFKRSELVNWKLTSLSLP